MVGTDRFGLAVNYLEDGYGTSNNLSKMVSKHGFKGFSPEGISSFLTFRYPVLDYTMFKGYKRIPFGHSLEDNTYKENWIPNFMTSGGMDFDSSLRMLDKLLCKTIKTDGCMGQVAVPLSGGIDSSLIVAILRDLFPQKEIHTYTAGFKGSNEFPYAQAIAQQFHTIHHEYTLDMSSFYNLMYDLIEFKAEPLHPNEIPLAFIEEKAKKDGCSIVMCGEGADDLFGGYSHLLSMYHTYDEVEESKTFMEYLLDNYRYFSIEDRKKYIHPKFLITDYMFVNDSLFTNRLPLEHRDQAFYFIQRLHTQGLITRGVNAMRYNGLHPSFPYINDTIVDFVNSMPFEWKLAWTTEDRPKNIHTIPHKDIADRFIQPKYILKKLAEKYLPKEIIYRPKVGFPVPFDEWLKDINTWDFDPEVFINNDLTGLSGWKKFMLINLDTFVKAFRGNEP